MRLAGVGWPSISYGSHGPHSVSSASARRWRQPARVVQRASWSRSNHRSLVGYPGVPQSMLAY